LLCCPSGGARVPPIVPCTWLQKLLRRGVHPSYPLIVRFTWVLAGTQNKVVCTHWWVLGACMKKLTPSGRLGTVFCASSFITTLTCPPEAADVHSTVGTVPPEPPM